jgi:hypothetical protein
MSNGETRDGDVVKKGTITPPQEVAFLKQLQDYFSISAAAERERSYGQWLFGAASIVGTLAAAFAATKPTGIIFFLAVGLVGISLAAAGMAVAPYWVEINPASPDSLLEGAKKQFAFRKKRLRVATICFAVAITLAGLTPLGATIGRAIEPARVDISYAMDDKGILTLTAVGHHPQPHSALMVELRPEVDKDDKSTLGQSITDDSGTATVQLKRDISQLHGKLQVLSRWSTKPSPTTAMIESLSQTKQDNNGQQHKQQ